MTTSFADSCRKGLWSIVRVIIIMVSRKTLPRGPWGLCPREQSGVVKITDNVPICSSEGNIATGEAVLRYINRLCCPVVVEEGNYSNG